MSIASFFTLVLVGIAIVVLVPPIIELSASVIAIGGINGLLLVFAAIGIGAAYAANN
ncbi:hypothetical protein NIES267_73200 (plasmid) [Calothrix parasitica NIES-267]|uniref:Uncharacterized protein n=1 Tax=Calothrix parasitica NIES-267 TaxID=1973488 RepID=A0A1Z4M2V7_9CYAN|nr:hypothetical protein NIES267_73200 [Calothrix parasitica NIES-267]